MASQPIVDYLVARDGLPPPSGLAYDYVLARSGVYLVAEHEHLAVCVPVASGHVRGLPEIEPFVQLKCGKLPRELWDRFVRGARILAEYRSELLMVVTHSPEASFELRVPAQESGPTRIAYEPVPHTVLELHSHHVLPACFSLTDDADEQGLRLYGVVGRLDRDPAQVRLRVGAYGYFLPVLWTDVFEGEHPDFADLSLDTNNRPPFEETDLQESAEEAATLLATEWVEIPLPQPSIEEIDDGRAAL